MHDRLHGLWLGSREISLRTLRRISRSVWASAALAVGMSVVLAAAATLLSTVVLAAYGWALFVGVPFTMGFFAAVIHGACEYRRLRQSLAVAVASVFVAGAVFLLLAFEGAICLLMAAPLTFPLAILGGYVGHVLQPGRVRRMGPQVYCIVPLAVPLMLGWEKLGQGPPPSLKVVTAIEVDAPVGTVWQHTVWFTELPPPNDLIFKLGIAYPIRAKIVGTRPHAVRHCIFSTGEFIEPIDTWDEPRLLKFSVTSNPVPLEEWTPYKAIHPPHLRGFLVSEKGQFNLRPLPRGRCRLEGTTWYHHGMWPASYWQIWSDQIIHRIHLRVLNHIKNVAEKETAIRGGPR